MLFISFNSYCRKFYLTLSHPRGFGGIDTEEILILNLLNVMGAILQNLHFVPIFETASREKLYNVFKITPGDSLGGTIIGKFSHCIHVALHTIY